ncbi:MAG: SMR family transporter [Nevskiales bacterium]
MTIAWLFCSYVLASAAGLVLIKQADTTLSWRYAAGFLLYGSGFLLWLWLLRRLPLSVAFPTAAGALIAATVLGGYVFLGEKLLVPQAVGIALILVGVVLVFSRGVAQ